MLCGANQASIMNNRVIQSSIIAEIIQKLIHEASFRLPTPVARRIDELLVNEDSDVARSVLEVLQENNRIAAEESLPLCQDCGIVIVFLEIGQQVSIEGNLAEAVDSGVAKAFDVYSLRKSVVGDPLRRINTGTNTPAVLHTELTEGSRLKITVYLKGGGSENMSSLRMLRPTDSHETIIDYIVGAVTLAGPNPCPPLFLGVGIGGTADAAMLNSKKAVLRGIDTRHPDPFYRDLEERIEKRINETYIGPLGFGGKSTAAGVYILEAPTHIAMLPVALNMNCHSLRYGSAEI